MEQVDLYIFTGQSNVGAAWLDNALDPFPVDSGRFLNEITKTKIFNAHGDKTQWTGTYPRWTNLLTGVNTAIHDPVYHSNFWGSEVSFAYYMDSCYIFKDGYGSAGIAFWTLSGSNIEFYANLYKAFSNAKINNVQLNLKGFIWIQSESDCGSAVKSAAYEAELHTLFTQFEQHYQLLCTHLGFPDNTATYKKIIFETKSSCTYLAQTEAAKISFCEDEANAIYWPVTDYALRYDNLHYTSLGYLQIGFDLYNYFKNGVTP